MDSHQTGHYKSMKFLDKKLELESIINKLLSPLIKQNFAYLDLPYHSNLGDILIWEGTEEFIKTIKHKCYYRSSRFTFDSNRIEENTTILLHGGGNFGDLYHEHQLFRMKVVEKFPRNRIIILPQSMHYTSKESFTHDIKTFSQHDDLHVFLRDSHSYDVLLNTLKNCYLAPDMAFCISTQKVKTKKTTGTKKLYFERIDIERDPTYATLVPEDAHIADWPTFNDSIFSLSSSAIKVYGLNLFFARLLNKMFSLTIHKYNNRVLHRLSDLIAYHIYRPLLRKLGLCFLNEYGELYLSRLHGAILSILMEKPSVLIDNNYGKISRFYNTWLYDLDDVKVLLRPVDNKK